MKITAVGGYRAVGRNMTGVSLDKKTIAIDNGIRLDTLQIYDDDTDMVRRCSEEELVRMNIIPDADRLNNVVCQVLSHGHLDHIGALPMNKPRVPIVATPYVTEMARSEYKQGDFYSIEYGQDYEVSNDITVELVEVTHSIPYASVVVLHTKEGDVIYTGDFRFDDHSQLARTNYKRLRELGNGNVKALIVESTRVRHEGKTPSEDVVRTMLKDVLEFIDKGLIVTTTFSTHIERIQSIVDAAEKSGRIPVILGRSLGKQSKLAQKFDILDLPQGTDVFSKAKAIAGFLDNMGGNREDYLLVVTGHQGEHRSILSRMTDGKFPFRFEHNDSVIFCARTIPGPLNAASRYILETKLRSQGVSIFDNIHVSGHAAREDHRRMLELLRPEHIIPCHGDMDMRSSYAELAVEEGYKINKNLHILTNGADIEI
ncbi:MAG: MBL fold metallo-hydrolase [Candidatus Altiarchaeota archaeon]|nr:MBL fold metallo-hydrolase [Candidatus Altiarchaeota archaeon]